MRGEERENAQAAINTKTVVGRSGRKMPAMPKPRLVNPSILSAIARTVSSKTLVRHNVDVEFGIFNFFFGLFWLVPALPVRWVLVCVHAGSSRPTYG